VQQRDDHQKTNTFKLQAKRRVREGKKSLSLLKSSFSRHNSVEIAYLIYYISLKCNFSIIKKLTICINYIIKIFQNVILEVFNSYVKENKEKISGKDTIVEVDESFARKGKYNIC
ncbi:hypothetical protein H312_03630, partial [Anncaliia algerae PRA339]